MSYWNNNNWNHKKTKDISLGFKEENGKEYYLDSDKSISQATFTFSNYTLRYMTEYWELKYFSNKYAREDLCCPLVDPTVSLEGCRFEEARQEKRKARLEEAQKKREEKGDQSDDSSSSDDEVEEEDEPQQCWCQFIYDMIHSEKAEATTFFFLPSKTTGHGYGYMIEVEGRFQKAVDDTSLGYIPTVEERKQKWRDLNIYYETGFEYHYPGGHSSSKKKHYVSLRYQNDSGKKAKIKSKDISINTVKFELSLEKIPKNLTITMGDQKYVTTPNITCDQGLGHLKNPCRPKTGLCWCSVINMLRSKGEAFMTIPMKSTGTTTSYYDYTMNFTAKRDPENHSLINVEIDFSGKYKNSGYNQGYYHGRYNYNNNYNGYESPDDDPYDQYYQGHQRGRSNYRGW